MFFRSAGLLFEINRASPIYLCSRDANFNLPHKLGTLGAEGAAGRRAEGVTGRMTEVNVTGVSNIYFGHTSHKICSCVATKIHINLVKLENARSSLQLCQTPEAVNRRMAQRDTVP